MPSAIIHDIQAEFTGMLATVAGFFNRIMNPIRLAEGSMSEDLIRQIAAEVVRQMPPMIGWGEYLVLAIVAVAGAALGSYLRARFTKSGEIAGIEANSQSILKQQEQTAKAVESIRTSIAHGDWHAREWKTLRRLKLEELMEAIHKTRAELLPYVREAAFGEEMPRDMPPTWKIMMLSQLYVPELQEEARNIVQKQFEYTLWASNKRGERQHISPDSPEYTDHINQSLGDMAGLEQAVNQAVANISAKAADLMKTFSQS